MKTPNLEKLAELFLALTWQEMQHIVGHDGFCSSYSTPDPKKLIIWAEQVLKTEEPKP